MPTIGALCVTILICFVLILFAAAVGVFPADAKWVQAAISLAAIIVALGLAVEQRFDAAKIRIEEMNQRHNSHRAKMHFALSKLHSYAAHYIGTLRNIIEQNAEEISLTKSILSFPEVQILEPDGNAIRDIAECISSCRDSKGARELSRLIQWTQIHLARMEALAARENHSVSNLEVAARLLDSARLQGMIGLVFPYARFQTEQIDVVLTGGQIAEVLIRNNIINDDPLFNDVYLIMPDREMQWQDFPT